MEVFKFIFILLEVIVLFNALIIVHELGHFLWLPGGAVWLSNVSESGLESLSLSVNTVVSNTALAPSLQGDCGSASNGTHGGD